jgi:predicted GTPase
MKEVFDCIIMGAAGRDFHNYLAFLRDSPAFCVRAFTAAQIPFIDSRSFPAELAGPRYDSDIPIHDESELPGLIRTLGIDIVFFAYSDISHEALMHKASLVQAAGASFMMLGPQQTQLHARLPVISVTATRTGAGKSPLTQWLARNLSAQGFKVAVIRHPMPYGRLTAQSVQRFETVEDLLRHDCTIEEREEYEPYVEMGIPIHAGVDYAAIVERAQEDADLVLWDGGNNDFSFIRPDLDIVVVDPLRAGHETAWYPGEVNFRRADVLVISKTGSATETQIAAVRQHAAELNPDAPVIASDLDITIEAPVPLEGRKVLVVEDGPTVTHGGMPHGAGTVAALKAGAVPVDPRPWAVGTIRDTYAQNPHLGLVLPAMGYSDRQRAELRETIHACVEAEEAVCVVDACPGRLNLAIDVKPPLARVSYRFQQLDGAPLLDRVRGLIGRSGSAAGAMKVAGGAE